MLTPADEVEILTAPRIPRRWLHVTLVFPGGPDPARAALGAAWFATRLRAIDKRLRLTVDRRRCAATAGELVLAFAPQRGGSLAAEWLEEVKGSGKSFWRDGVSVIRMGSGRTPHAGGITMEPMPKLNREA